jgi:acyl-CoA synthetase (AMP-forming)/AMP-acid ligase II
MRSSVTPGRASARDARPRGTQLEDSLLAWIFNPDSARGIRFAGLDDAWEFHDYAGLARDCGRVSCGLRHAGVGRDAVVCIAARTGPAFVGAFFGSMLCGATPSPLAPPLLFENPVGYRAYIAGALHAARPAIVLTDSPQARDEIAAATGAWTVRVIDDLRGTVETYEPLRSPPEIGLLQFTSGSSAASRGVRLPSRALAANATAIRRWLRWAAEDAFACWLPLHHDMGLIGALVCSVVGQNDLWLLQPEQFIRRPLRYLQCFGARGAALSVMSAFGLDYIARRVQPDSLADYDFSRWRGLVVGAERIDRGALHRFSTLLAPRGFDPRALLPAYGLAEATLAVTGTALDEGWTSIAAKPASLSVGREVVDARDGDPSQVVVSCGRTLGGASVEIVDDGDRPVPDGRVGEIVVRGPSVAAGYVDTRDDASTRLVDDVLRTGDAGFVRDGRLFVLGRLGDSMKVRGRTVFVEELEIAVAALGVPRERVAALLGINRGRPTATVIVERFRGRVEDVQAAIRQHAEGADALVIAAPSGTIEHTTSGKPKRRRLWNAFVNGTLPGVVHVSAAEDIVNPP